MIEILVPTLFLLLILSIIYVAMVGEYLPNYVAAQVRVAPLDKELDIDLLNIHSFDESGIEVKLKATILKSMLPYEYLKLTVRLPFIDVFLDQHLIGQLLLSSPVELTGKTDVRLNQELKFKFASDLSAILPVIRRVSAIGQSEVNRLKLQIEFKLTIETGFFTLKDIPCFKVIALKEVAPKTKTVQGPVPTIKSTPFIRPFLGGIYAGLNILFDSIPALQFHIETIEFQLCLNGHAVADCWIEKLGFEDCQEATIAIKITPLSTYRPITGSISIAKGLVKGAINGFANGILFGEWGNQSMVIMVNKLKIIPEKENLRWLTDIASNLEIEHNVNVLSNVQHGATTIKGALDSLFVDVLKRPEIGLSK